jgi:hypothetical protein
MVSFPNSVGQWSRESGSRESGSRQLADALQQAPWVRDVCARAKSLVQSMISVGQEHGRVGEQLVQRAQVLFDQFEVHARGSVDRGLLLGGVHDIFQQELDKAFGDPNHEGLSARPDSPQEALRAEIECHLMETWDFTPADCCWS